MDSSSTTIDNPQEANSAGDNAEGKTSHYYDIGKHKAALWAWLILIALGLTVIFSLGIGWIEHAYSGWFGTVEEQTESGQSGLGFNLGVLPDFFGSMAGILVGFILEWLIFEKIKNLSKYQTMISCLYIEFDKIRQTLRDSKRVPLREIILKDIVSSAENSVIIYKLPHYCFLMRSKQGKYLLDLLQEIYGYIVKRNKDLKKAGEGERERGGEPYSIKADGERDTTRTWAKLITDNIKKFNKAAIKESKSNEKK